jgi:site-specific DNA-methyltransferase (adenine-specific)
MQDLRNVILIGDVLEKFATIPDKSVHLVVTSPPYNVGIEYNEHHDNMLLDDYLAWMRKVIAELYRVLVIGGRVAWNVANTGRKPYIPLNAYFAMLFKDCGFTMRGENVWNKGRAVAASKTSWGSWRDARSPQFRDCHEYVQVYYKIDPVLNCDGFEKGTVSGHDFALESFSVWDICPETSREIRAVHKAVFPTELPRRCIEFLTRPGMTVLDCFGGTGTTAVACLAMPEPRNYIMIEIDLVYVKLARKRIAAVSMQKLESFLPRKIPPKPLEAFTS